MIDIIPDATLADDRPESRPYTPFGGSREMWMAREKEVLLSGPAGTGKSRACLEKLHFCAEKYPGFRGLILRKTRESLTESALVTLEQNVVPVGHPALRGAARGQRKNYVYPNGSEIMVGGITQSGKLASEKVMSTEYDIIYVQEAIELTVENWEKCTTRLRNEKMPYQQLIADTNPSAPSHWLKQRCETAATRYINSYHEDNPRLWDQAAKTWTPSGLIYIERLDALTGARKERLRFGRWVQAEGVVYDQWDPRIHVLPKPVNKATGRMYIPESWRRYWVVDFGYTDPFVCQWWAKDEDGRLHRYREIYRTGRLVEDHARLMLELSKDEPRPYAVICDHDAEGAATLRKYLKLPTIPAKKEISKGVELVMARLRVAGDGRPRLFYYKDALVEVDLSLRERGLPQNSEAEMECYVWDVLTGGKMGGRVKGDLPLDRDNHGMDCTRYMVAHLDLGQAQTASFKPVGAM